MTMGPHLQRTKTFVLMAMGLAMISRAASGTQNSYCSDETPDIGDEIRPTLDYSYSTQISGKMMTSKTREYIYEYFDKKRNMLAFDSTIAGSRISEIHYLKKGYTLYKGYSACKLFKTPLNAKTIKEQGMRSLEILLSLGKVWKYKGEKTIRGVKVKQWRSCSGWAGDYANFTSDFFFTLDKIPFRIDVNGVTKVGKMRMIYDYILFQNTTPSPEVFLLPPGVYCGNSTTMLTPEIAESARFRMEIIDPIKKKAWDVQIYFNKQTQFSMEDNANNTKIHDYKRGVQFILNKKTKTCSRRPLTRFVSSEEVVNDKGIIQMASLKHFLFDDGNFTYNGIRKARGISCEVYTKTSNAAEELGESVIEMYIAVRKGSGSDIGGFVRQPVRIVLMGGDDHRNLVVKRRYEIYDFDTGKGVHYHPVSLDPCFSQDRMIHFEMEFKGQTADSSHWSRDFLDNVAKTISDALKISSLRVSTENAVVGEKVTKVYGALYGREQPYGLFQVATNRKLASKLIPGDYAKYKNKTNTPTVCADYCAIQDGRPFDMKGFCEGFQFDRGTKECTFYNHVLYKRNKHDESLTFSTTIDFYRWAISKYNNEFYLSRSWSELKRMVGEGLINSTDSIGTILKATSVKKKRNKDITEYFGEESPVKKFMNFTGVVDASPAEVRTPMRLEACARHCLTALKYTCQSFMFERKDSKCTLYDVNNFRQSHAHEIKNDDRIFFMRDYISYFDGFYGRSTLSPTSDEVYTGVKDGNACAQLCLSEDKFHCESFELCGGACLLGRKHIYQAPSTDVRQDYSCLHFSRSYVQDYTKIKNKKALRDSGVVKVGNIGVKQCATMCSTSTSYDCDVFEFCDSDSLCRLTTTPVKNADDLVYEDSGHCDLYSRKKGIQRVTSSGFNFANSMGGSDDGGHSANSMGGIAVGMIFLGIVVMVVGILIFHKLKSRVGGPDGMDVGFHKSISDN